MGETIYYSVITEIELLSARHLTPEDTVAIQEFLARCQRVELTPEVIERTIDLRKTEQIKTPDAIVAASALVLGATLITADKRLDRIVGLETISDILE
jgi:predicted nucleic acid-binding protein